MNGGMFSCRPNGLPMPGKAFLTAALVMPLSVSPTSALAAPAMTHTKHAASTPYVRNRMWHLFLRGFCQFRRVAASRTQHRLIATALRHAMSEQTATTHVPD